MSNGSLRQSQAYRHYLADTVLGGIDGCVTTFAIVAGVSGATFPTIVAIVLGFANLFADGVSMAVSNYEATQSRESETGYRHSPLAAGSITFASFLVTGAFPLIPLMLVQEPNLSFVLSAIVAGLIFFLIGILKGYILGHSLLNSGFKTLLTGGSAAALAYCVGYFSQSYIANSIPFY